MLYAYAQHGFYILCLRENYSAAENSYVKCSDKSRRPSCSEDFHEDNENKNPNFSAPIPNLNGGVNKLKKPLMMRSNTNRDDPKKQLNDSIECPEPVKSHRRSKLKSTFSAQNLLGGREILSQITGLCSELKRLARKGSKRRVK